jgi:hypothetical protein
VDKLKYVKELPKDKVEVEDENGSRWIISHKAYNRFRRPGFLYVPKEVASAFLHTLNGRNFGDMSGREQFDVIKKVIEIATHEPLERSLPNIEEIQ